MRKLLRLMVAVFVSVGLTTGVAAAATGSLDNTGPFSDNEIVWENDTDVDIENRTDVNADIRVDQDADSGDAIVKHNTTGGDAESGEVMNESSFDAELSIDNSGSSAAALACGCAGGGNDSASIDTTGPNSDNKIKFDNNTDVRVDNKTNVRFDLNVDQDADSGDADVWGNTTGGSATTGGASNSSSATFNLSVTN